MLDIAPLLMRCSTTIQATACILPCWECTIETEVPWIAGLFGSMMLLECDPNDQEGSLKLIEELTTNANRVQQQVLDEILSRNSHTEYLHTFLKGLGHSSTDRDAFKKQVPIVDYEQVRPYIERIANGAPANIISSHPITELLTSSGTSGGQPKMMPSTNEDLDRKTFMYNLLIPVMNQYVEGLGEGKGMYLLFVKPEISTPSGLPARPVLTSYYKSANFRSRPFNRYNVYTSPDETILTPDGRQSMYAQLLCGLVQRTDVLRVGAVFASAFLRAIKFLEDNWEELCYNIRDGRLSDWVSDAGCRSAVAGVLTRPEPELAAALEAECGSGTWEGIVRRLWPRTKYIEVIVTGSMAQYITQLEFYGGGLPLLSTMYASSECYFGLNLLPLSSPADVSYILLPNMCYFEFIPVEMHDDDEEEQEEEEVVAVAVAGGDTKCLKRRRRREEEVVDLVDVEVGRYYELVVTTFTGLYRYRVGDILMVTGFYNASPQFRFIHRRNVVLSVDTDKTSEADLLAAVTQAKLLLGPLGLLLTEYTSYADTSSIPGHYVLFWELHRHRGSGCAAAPSPDNSVMEDCCHTVEAALDSVYRRCRSRDRSVGPLEIRVVRPGAFDALMDFCVSQGSSVNQYKTPRCVKAKEAIDILDERVVGRFFSNKVPVWEPYRMGAASL